VGSLFISRKKTVRKQLYSKMMQIVITILVTVKASVGNRAARERAEKKVLITASCKMVYDIGLTGCLWEVRSGSAKI
jgi:hypothetical protein